MSDDRLRSLERAWRESRDPAAGQAYVHALKRYGGGVKWVAFAGYLGDLQIRELLDMRGRCQISGPKQLRRWIYRARAWGWEGYVRLAWSAATAVQPSPVLVENARLLDSVRAWIRCPCELHAKAVHAIEPPPSPLPGSPHGLETLAVRAAGQAVVWSQRPAPVHMARDSAFRACEAAANELGQQSDDWTPRREEYLQLQAGIVSAHATLMEA